MRKLAPGLYDNDGELHIDAVEYLLDKGIEPTPENQQALADAMHDVARDRSIPSEERDSAESW